MRIRDSESATPPLSGICVTCHQCQEIKYQLRLQLRLALFLTENGHRSETVEFARSSCHAFCNTSAAPRLTSGQPDSRWPHGRSDARKLQDSAASASVMSDADA